MTREEIAQRSYKKLEQINNLMVALNVTQSIKQRLDSKTGYIEHLIVFNDNEKYVETPVNPVPAPDKLLGASGAVNAPGEIGTPQPEPVVDTQNG